ncbi:MAG TPA: hypothetical protein VFQ65_26055, partial [Kofleriaceae bacterium]|nr:hypothetical protein [Kofleriaceae bacterium]
MRRVVLGLLLVVGCRQVFGIHDPGAGDDHAGDAPSGIDAATCTMASVQCAGQDQLRTCSAAGATPAFERCD